VRAMLDALVEETGDEGEMNQQNRGGWHRHGEIGKKNRLRRRFSPTCSVPSIGSRSRPASKARTDFLPSSRGSAGSPTTASCPSVTACGRRLRRHHAAAIDGVRIAVESLEVPDTGGRPLVIEGSGGPFGAARSHHALHRRLCPGGRLSGGAVRAHGAWHHQSFAALDRSAAQSPHRTSRHRLYRRGAIRKAKRAICEIGNVRRLATTAAGFPPLKQGARWRTAFTALFNPRDFGP